MNERPNEIPHSNELKIDLFKMLFRIVPIYLLYFILASIIIVKRFGKITYGPNIGYLVSLVVIGAPFIICFWHIMSKADSCRIGFVNSGGDKDKASRIIILLMILVTFVILKITILSFELMGDYGM